MRGNTLSMLTFLSTVLSLGSTSSAVSVESEDWESLTTN